MKLADIKARAAPILRSYGIKKASVFGSAARGEDRPESDIDFLVQFGKPMGMVLYIRFLEQMGNSLQKKVDVVTEQSLNKFVRPHIQQDLTTIYEE